MIHMGLATLSVAGFTLRWSWLMRGSTLIEHPLTRTLPHVGDTLFLASGIALAVILQLNPLEHAWLGVKLVALPVYVALAHVAYRRARRARTRALFFVLALITFAWLVTVACLKHPLGIFSTA